MYNDEQVKEKIDILTEKLVLNFEDNEFVKEIIKKLREIKGYIDIDITDKSITSWTESHMRKITVDERDSKAELIDLGIKETDDKKTYYRNELHYSENNEKHTCTRYNTEANIERKDNKNIVNYTTYSSTIGGSNNRCNFYSSAKNIKKFEKYSDDEYILLDESSNKKDFYRLANGDVLKIVDTGDKERYFYCDSSILYGEENIDDNKPKFNVELDKNKATTILKKLDDPYALINNEDIYNIKGKSY